MISFKTSSKSTTDYIMLNHTFYKNKRGGLTLDIWKDLGLDKHSISLLKHSKKSACCGESVLIETVFKMVVNEGFYKSQVLPCIKH